MTAPVYEGSVGLIVEDHRRDAFRTWDAARELGASLRLAVPNREESIAEAKALVPQATLVPMNSLEDQKKILESGAADVDAVADLSEEGAAWSLLYPRFSLVVPKPPLFMPVAYSVAPGNDSLLEALNAWLLTEKSRGTVDGLYGYWMLGEAESEERPPRWSVVRDVLHWVE